MKNINYPYIELLVGFRFNDPDKAMSAILTLQRSAGGVALTPEEGKKISRGELIREGFILIYDSESNLWGIACENREMADKVREKIRPDWP